jgi:hypothetical protein
MTAPVPAAGGPNTGPETGDFDASLAALAAMAERLQGNPEALAEFEAAVRRARVACR